MTYQDPKYHLSILQDSLIEIEESARLLKIASKQAEFTEENFDNINLLVAIAESRLTSQLEDLSYHLKVIGDYVSTHITCADIII